MEKNLHETCQYLNHRYRFLTGGKFVTWTCTHAIHTHNLYGFAWPVMIPSYEERSLLFLSPLLQVY